MYHINCDGTGYDNFHSVEDAESWLEGVGWKKVAGDRWYYLRPGKATLFATIEVKEEKRPTTSDLLAKMRE